MKQALRLALLICLAAVMLLPAATIAQTIDPATYTSSVSIDPVTDENMMAERDDVTDTPDGAPEAANIAVFNASDSESAIKPGTVKVMLFNEPRAMRLPQNTTSFWFMLPQGTELGDDSLLTLDYSVTGTLLEDYSSLTLIINDVQVASTRMIRDINDTGTWQVSIPAERLKTDGTLNELRIRSAQRSILGDCADIDNPSNWLIFQDSSNLLLDIAKQGDLLLSNALPYFFNQPDYVNLTSAEFVLPSVIDSAMSSAVLSVSSAVGAQYAAKDEVEFTLSAGQPSGSVENRIFIGHGYGASVFSPVISQVFQLPDLTSPATGLLAVNRSEDFRNLLIVGSDADGLAKSTAFLTSNYVSQLSGGSAVITSSPEVTLSNFTKKDDGYYTLADFGYDSTSLEGAFHQETTFTLKQPEAISSGPDSYVEIHFRHSKALLGDSSLLTVYVNNVAINSIQLSASNADNGMIKVKIPADALLGSTIEVKIECYNYLGKIDCSKDYYDTAWTVIDKDSVVYFAPGSTLIVPTLQQFPVFDPQTSSAQAIAPSALLSMPSDASATLREVAAALACRAGQNSGFACVWQHADALDTSPIKSSSDIIIVGSDEQIDIPKDITDKLYFVPRGKDMYSSSGAIATTAEVLRDKIILQVIRSPWNFSRKVYVIICPVGMEQQLKELASQRQLLNQLNAPVALIDTAGVVSNLGLAETGVAEHVPLTADRVVGQVVLQTGIPRTGLLIIAICVVIIIILIFVALSNRRRFVTARQKMSEINNAPKKDEDEDDEDALMDDEDGYRPKGKE